MSDFRLVVGPLSGAIATLFRLLRRSETERRGVSSDRRQISDSDQIVSRGRELKDPTYQPEPAMTCLTQQPHGLQPTKDLFHSFALALTDRIARVTSRALVNGTTTASLIVLGDMRSHAARAQLSHEALRVISLVGGQGHALFRLAQQPERRLAFCGAAGMRQLRVNHQTVPMLHQYVTLISQFGFAALSLLKQAQVAVSSRL